MDAEKAAVAESAGALMMDRAASATSGRGRSSRSRALENAIASVAATGGSTNAVLHLLAIAREAGVAAGYRRFRPHQFARCPACRSEAWRQVRGDRPAIAPAAFRSWPGGCSKAGFCTPTR